MLDIDKKLLTELLEEQLQKKKLKFLNLFKFSFHTHFIMHLIYKYLKFPHCMFMYLCVYICMTDFYRYIL